MKKFLPLLLGLVFIVSPMEAKKKDEQKKEEKPVNSIQVTKDLRTDQCYFLSTDGAVWMVDSVSRTLVSAKSQGVKKQKKNDWQWFMLYPAKGNKFYLYHVGGKAFVNREGKLTEKPVDPILLTEGKKGKFKVSFGDSLFVQRNDAENLCIGKAHDKEKYLWAEIERVKEHKDKNGQALMDEWHYIHSVSQGLFNVKQNKDEWFWDIPDSLLERRILLTVRYTGTPVNTRKYGGELVKQQTVYWEVSPKGDLLLRAEMSVVAADSACAINKAVEISDVNPIIASFKVVNHVNGRYRINVAPLFNKDEQAIGLSSNDKQQFGLGMYNADLSYIESMKTFPMNTEVRTVKTWTSTANRTMAGYRSGKVTLGFNYSFVLLPKNMMQRRLFDPRVGYFADGFVRFSDQQQHVESERFIVRYRLEPKDSVDAERMKRGELVEPKKPIIYYIDPATPKQWRKYLIQGVNDWQKAFEQAGFKNAIFGKEWPENDPTMSMEDARYSVIRYLASDIPNAYGPNVHDPRTGEIIESHVCWYHNVMKLVHDWYMVQAGSIDEAARKMNYDEELMGQLIRFVSSHEVGHSLGLRHNFGSSSTVPVDSLRNKAWVEKYGHTPSIMDYARFNYVAQPEDGISRDGIFPRINDYDMWAIEWGYRPMFAADPMADHAALETLMKEKHDGNRRLWFGDGETNRTRDSRCQTEDLGDDAIKASEYGILNLKRGLAQLPAWSRDEKDIYATQLQEMYNAHYTQLLRYMGHVLGNLGGVYYDFKTIDQTGKVYTHVSRERQLEVMEFIRRHVATEPRWLIEVDYIDRLLPNPQEQTLRFARSMMNNLVALTSSMTDAYPAADYLNHLSNMMFTEARSGGKLTPYRMTLQREMVANLCAALRAEVAARNQFTAPVLNTLRQLQSQLRSASGNAEARAHYASLLFTIEKTLNAVKTL